MTADPPDAADHYDDEPCPDACPYCRVLAALDAKFDTDPRDWPPVELGGEAGEGS